MTKSFCFFLCAVSLCFPLFAAHSNTSSGNVSELFRQSDMLLAQAEEIVDEELDEELIVEEEEKKADKVLPEAPSPEVKSEETVVDTQMESEEIVEDAAGETAENVAEETMEEAQEAVDEVPVPEPEEKPLRKSSDNEIDIDDILVEEGREEESAGEEEVGAEEDDILVEESSPEVIVTEEEGGIVEEETVPEEAVEAALESIPPVVDTQAVVVAPVKVEEARSINFARNLEDYRSPKLAMLMSLFVPGLGQAYAKKYWKTGLFAAVEIGVVGASVAYYRKGLERDKDAREHADKYFDFSRFESYYTTLKTKLEDRYQSSQLERTYADTVLDSYFGYGYQPDTLKKHYAAKNEEFYAMVEWHGYVQGWTDCVPRLDTDHGYGTLGEKIADPQSVAGDTVYISGDTVITTSSAEAPHLENGVPFKLDRRVGGKMDPKNDQSKYGFSGYYNQYKDIVYDKNKQFRISGTILYLMIANHIVSAIDAGITAKRHNEMLLGRQSFWQRIDLDQQWVNTGSEKVIGCALRYKF
ncbi:MAG: hypothetical protein GF401_02115 [Chitinivibrionales bacterium]|nr:hypothetical protein [Chitinivibrionales bacterium]